MQRDPLRTTRDESGVTVHAVSPSGKWAVAVASRDEERARRQVEAALAEHEREKAGRAG